MLRLACVFCLSLAVMGRHGWADEDVVRYRRDVQPLVAKYCLDCHSGDEPEGDLSLAGFSDAASMREKTSAWERAVKMLKGGLMPPDDAPQPSTQQRRRMIASIEALLYHVDCKLDRDPGRVTIRRLNRNEYNNTVRDLLLVDLRPADSFPADDVGDGFDNIGDVLSLPPLLMEKYLDAAEQLAAAAIVTPESAAPARQKREGDQLTSTGAGRRGEYDELLFFSRGAAVGKFQVKQAGPFEILLQAAADQAGPDPAKAQIKVNGKPLATVDVKAVRGQPQAYRVKANLPQGDVEISAEFINDYYQPKAKDPKLRGDRNLVVHHLEIVGQAAPPAKLPPSHQRLLIARPDKDRGVDLREAALQCLRPFVRRAFRRPVSDAEVGPYVKLVELAVSRKDSFERGVQVAVTAVLLSPQFLFRVERDPDPNDPAKKHALNQFELASRLSYFLWSSMPDDRLFTLAGEGQLNKDEVLIREAQRMLKDPRAAELAANFAGQWLNLRNLDEMAPDPNQFADFSPQLREDMKRETLLFFAAVVEEDRSILDFVQGDFTFVNERLARHYGIKDVRGEKFRRREQPLRRRAGVLAQGSVLTLTSNPTRTSPVKRGKWIMENLLGTPPPDPPADVPELASTQKASPNATLRQQLELHRSNETCAVCHRQMDALGFGLENFDAVGRWRDNDQGKPVDARGELPNGDRFSGPAELAGVLSRRREQISRNLSEKLMTFALGRGLQYFDRCAVDKIVQRLDNNGHRFSELVNGIVLSEPFRQRRGEALKP